MPKSYKEIETTISTAQERAFGKNILKMFGVRIPIVTINKNKMMFVDFTTSLAIYDNNHLILSYNY